MNIELKLSPLKLPRFGPALLGRGPKVLAEITERNRLRANGDGGSMVFGRRKQELVERLHAAAGGGDFDQVTDVPDRQRLLISLYAEFGGDGSQGWLPAFDTRTAHSVLGKGAASWHAGRRRQAALLFFARYMDLGDGLPILCARLREAFAETPAKNPPTSLWQPYAHLLFRPDGAQRIAEAALPDEEIDDLIQRFGIPEGGFAETLRRVYLLRVLADSPLGEGQKVLPQIRKIRDAHESPSTLMGAAALRILVRRVKKEGRGIWPTGWEPWILRLGCDPRLGRSSAEGARWWHWASDDELRLAQRGVTGLTLAFFLKFLDGTVDAEQWQNRSEFLLQLFHERKIEDARLVVNAQIFNRLPTEHRGVSNVSRLIRTTEDTSMICLRCVDDVFLIEGTHSFGLRVFKGRFPVRDFWETPKRDYTDTQIRITPTRCPVFIRHDQGGNWRQRFYEELRRRWHLEWA